MKPLLSMLLMAMLCQAFTIANAQRKEDFHLTPKRVPISSSYFSHIEVIDTRNDTVNIGFVQRGGFNRKALLSFTKPLATELTTTIDTLLQNSAKQEGTLLINVRRFFISEVTGGMSEEGRFSIKAGFYAKKDDHYIRLAAIDTSVVIKSGWDVSTRLLDTTSEAFGWFIKEAVSIDPATCNGVTYTADDIQHINQLEKKGIPVYNVELPKKGMYASYEEFKNNAPSREDFIVEHRKGFSRPFFYEQKENGKKGSEIGRKAYYIVCDGEKMYVSRPNTIYELIKKDGDFYFTGLGKDAADAGTVVAASMLFGVLGGAAAAGHDTATFEFQLDYVTGKWVAIRKIKD
jgi:hypothetical protein